MKLNIISLSCVVFLTLTTQLYCQSSPKPNELRQQRQLILGQVVAEPSAVPVGKIDHTPWNQLLEKYVDHSGGVNYRAWSKSDEDSQLLDQYIDQLSQASLKKASRRADQMAFWINAYNAVTVKGILQEYPTTSIRNHTSEDGGYNIWKNLLLNVGGQQISLDSIEHQMLRPMGDPRIHFAIVCASKGCPPLLNEAYVGKTLSSQLDKNAKHFFSLEQNFQHDPKAKNFKLSAILQWFGSDFGANQAAQLRTIARYLPTRQAKAAARGNAVSVSFLDYSWELNEQPNAVQPPANVVSRIGQK